MTDPPAIFWRAVLYLIWAYTPKAVLEAHGITWYPSRHWAVALPAWACVTVVFAYWVYER
jgi:phosphatidylinositol glycan class P protein